MASEMGPERVSKLRRAFRYYKKHTRKCDATDVEGRDRIYAQAVADLDSHDKRILRGWIALTSRIK